LRLVEVNKVYAACSYKIRIVGDDAKIVLTCFRRSNMWSRLFIFITCSL